MLLEEIRVGQIIYVPNACFYVGDTHHVGRNAIGRVERIDIADRRGPSLSWCWCSVNEAEPGPLPSPQGTSYGLIYNEDNKPELHCESWVLLLDAPAKTPL